MFIKYFDDKKKEKAEKIELLRSIAKSLKALESTIEYKGRYDGAVKTTNAARY